MSRRPHLGTSLILGLCMFILILDTKTAVHGASQGVMLCIKTVIPSLFPFFVISSMIMPALTGKRAAFLRPIGKLCGIPSGAESLLFLGLVGGYPVGAQCINDAWKSNKLSANCGQRLLAFCNNAGPSFIFGIGCSLFDSTIPILSAWVIQILSAVIVGCITARKTESEAIVSTEVAVTLPQALEKSIHNISIVCGWVILFRVIVNILYRWILWIMPYHVQIFITGLIELSNGCAALSQVDYSGLRYIMFNIFLSFGGICVAMQTVSATKDIGIGMYFPGKLLQCCLTLLMSILTQPLLFPAHERFCFPTVYIIIVVAFAGIFALKLPGRKKTVAFSG